MYITNYELFTLQKINVFLFVCLVSYYSNSQTRNDLIISSQFGTRNYDSGKESFSYGIIGSNIDATGSPVGLVSAIKRSIPSAKKISDKYGNANISLRGRNSIYASGDEVLWEIDGVIFQSPPMISINEVVYVEVIRGLAATNMFGSDGGAGVIIVKTSVSSSNKKLISSSKNLWKRHARKKLGIN